MPDPIALTVFLTPQLGVCLDGNGFGIQLRVEVGQMSIVYGPLGTCRNSLNFLMPEDKPSVSRELRCVLKADRRSFRPVSTAC